MKQLSTVWVVLPGVLVVAGVAGLVGASDTLAPVLISPSRLLLVLLVSVVLYILPGWALLTLLWPGSAALLWAEKAGLAAGLSLALSPLLLLWSDVIGLHLGALYAWLPPVVALLALLWHYRTWRPAHLGAVLRGWARSEMLWPDMALLVVLVLLFGVRLLVIGGLAVPLWGDSYHHTMIAQLLVDHGGLFDSWQPYAELTTFTYHYGFHTAVALFHWLTGMALHHCVLWVGQVLNGLAVLALYPLTIRIGGNRWAGVVAVLLAGLLAQMPMFYTNWGRYTQLTGQIILPVAVWGVWGALETPQRDWRTLVLAWVALAGLGLTHYRVLIFFAPFLLAFLLLKLRSGRLRPLLVRMVWLGLVATVLVLPWYLNVLAGKLVTTVATSVALGAQHEEVAALLEQSNAPGSLTTYLPTWLWLLLPLSVGWGLWQRRRGVVLLALWWFGALLLVNPHWLHLPGTGPLTNFALFLAAYLPVGVLVGAAAGWLIGTGRSRATAALLCLCLSGVALWGATERLDDIDVETHTLVTPADRQAFTWVRENTPPDARFLVNAFFTYNGTAIVGSDAGWWLPLLAHRQTMLPPLTYNSEQGPTPDYIAAVNRLVFEIAQRGIDDPQVQALLRERGITHVYIGQRQGSVNSGGVVLLPLEQLRASPHFRLLYDEEGVTIFAFTGGAAGEE